MIWAALLPLVGGCAAHLELPASVAPLELDAVPFFAQTEFQCGPAALATILTDAGASVTPEALVDAVYIEGLRGSLQPELLGATRRQGFIPYVLEPEPAALFAELAANRPVLVLQNLGFDRAPVWHYAVLVGVDPGADRVILRSGTERRLSTSTKRFLRSWQRGENWAFVALAPGTHACDGHGRAIRARARGRGDAVEPRRDATRPIERRSSAGRKTSWCCSLLRPASTTSATSRARLRCTVSCLCCRPSTRPRTTIWPMCSPSEAAWIKPSPRRARRLAFVSSSDALYAAISETVADIENGAPTARPAQCQ